MRNRVSPGKQVSMIDNYSPSQGGDSVYEEEKSDMMMLIDTVNNPVQELKSSKSQDPFKN